MGILFRRTREVFITPTLPSSFPYVKLKHGSLYITIDGYCTPYTSLDNYLNIIKSYNVTVRTTFELSDILDVSLIEVQDGVFLVNGELHKLDSLNSLAKVLSFNLKSIKDSVDSYGSYFNVFKEYSSKGTLHTLKSVPKTSEKVVDFEGRVFPNQSAMLSFYGIPRGTFYDRIGKGLSLKDALTLPKVRGTEEYVDHEGRVFTSKQAMVDFYGINIATFNARIRRGYSLKDALTSNINEANSSKRVECTDLQGRLFPSLTSMAKYHNVIPTSLNYLVRRGYTPTEALRKLLKEV